MLTNTGTLTQELHLLHQYIKNKLLECQGLEANNRNNGRIKMEGQEN